MNGSKLQDRLYMGAGVSARFLGEQADAFRPKGPLRPLDNENRFIRLPAVFVSAKGRGGQTNVYGEALWHGIFDASYTRAGDYIVLPTGTFFIASQNALSPVLCVRANRVITVVRPNMQTYTAGNTYGGYTTGSSTMLMERWPASVLGETRSSPSTTDLPTDQAVPYWNVLLPATARIVLSPGDLISDDLNRTAAVAGSELTDLGWRLSAKMATT